MSGMVMDGFLVTFALLEIVMAIVNSILGCVLLCCPSTHQVRNGGDGHSELHPGLCPALLSLHTPGQEWG